MKLITNNKLLSELSKRNINLVSGSGNKMFTETNTIKDCLHKTLVASIKSLKPRNSKMCLFLTDRKQGLTCLFDDFIVASYSALFRLSHKNEFLTNNMILFAYLDNEVWNASDIFWIVGKSDIPFIIASDFTDDEIKDSNRVRTIIKRVSKMKPNKDEILRFLENTLN